MPIYSFHCPNCTSNFEVYKSREQASEQQVCPDCSSLAERDWQADNVYMKEPLKTLGSLADKNAATKSNDEKDSILSRNRRNPTTNAFNP